MKEEETPLTFECAGETLMGILHGAKMPTSGVVMVVGGPQYRIGSHRLYVQLARKLAASGVAVLRFDHRGIGDGSGAAPGFENLHEDIRSAVYVMRQELPSVKNLVLLGLCDGASAVLLSGQKSKEIRGLVLINPWVRTSALEARTRFTRYYTRRLASWGFWRKIAAGRFSFRDSGRSMLGYLRDASAGVVRGTLAKDVGAFVPRMLAELEANQGTTLVVLSGHDLVAQEFKELVSTSDRWRKALAQPSVEVINLPMADHTFSARTEREMLENGLLDWLRKLS